MGKWLKQFQISNEKREPNSPFVSKSPHSPTVAKSISLLPPDPTLRLSSSPTPIPRLHLHILRSLVCLMKATALVSVRVRPSMSTLWSRKKRLVCRRDPIFRSFEQGRRSYRVIESFLGQSTQVGPGKRSSY